MKNLLPNLSKIPPRVSIRIIAASQRAMSDYYDTTDSRIAVKYERRNGVSRVVSVDFVQ